MLESGKAKSLPCPGIWHHFHTWSCEPTVPKLSRYERTLPSMVITITLDGGCNHGRGVSGDRGGCPARPRCPHSRAQRECTTRGGQRELQVTVAAGASPSCTAAQLLLPHHGAPASSLLLRARLLLRKDCDQAARLWWSCPAEARRCAPPTQCPRGWPVTSVQRHVCVSVGSVPWIRRRSAYGLGDRARGCVQGRCGCWSYLSWLRIRFGGRR